MKRLLKSNGTTRTWFHSLGDGRVAIETEEDLSESKKHVHRLRTDDNYYRNQFKAGGTMHAAHIPAVMQMKMFHKYGVKVWEKGHTKEVMKILTNDPEFEGCIVNRSVITKKRDFSAGMKQTESGIWQPNSAS